MNAKILNETKPIAMSKIQYVTMILIFLLNVLDGMDVLVIAFTAPVISKEWNISPETLGIVFSSALAGMVLGALLIAPFADKIGRKNMVLICATLMGSSIFLTSFSTSLWQLMVLRFMSGLGIGSMMASISTLASEFAPEKSKDFWVSFCIGGYPLGSVLTGLIAAEIIPNYGWRAMFQLAGLATLLVIPLVLFFMVESVSYLLEKQPKNALEKVNNILLKLGKLPILVLPEKQIKKAKISVVQLLSKKYLQSTIVLWICFFLSFSVIYFHVSWIPKLTSVAGIPQKIGIYSGTVLNIGAFIGVMALGGVAMKWGLKKMIFVFMAASAAVMLFFGYFSNPTVLLLLFGLIGFTMQGGFVGLYPSATRIYPTEFRTTGVGWALGIGRLGAVAGPILAGFLVGEGYTISQTFIVFAIPAFLAGSLVFLIDSDQMN